MSLSRFLPIFLLLALGACNTMEGFGQDVETAGEAIEGEAEQGL